MSIGNVYYYKNITITEVHPAENGLDSKMIVSMKQVLDDFFLYCQVC